MYSHTCYCHMAILHGLQQENTSIEQTGKGIYRTTAEGQVGLGSGHVWQQAHFLYRYLLYSEVKDYTAYHMSLVAVRRARHELSFCLSAPRRKA